MADDPTTPTDADAPNTAADDADIAADTRVLDAFLTAQRIAIPDYDWRAPIDRLYDLLVDANTRVNLTRILNRREYVVKHVADSLLVLAVCPDLATGEYRIADVGCGGGFPGLPLSLFCEGSSFLEIDSVGKKIAIVDSFIQDLRLPNCEVLHGNTRELSNQRAYKNGFDVVLARAVGPTPRLIQDTHRLLKGKRSRLIAFKTPTAVETERAETEVAASKAGLKIAESRTFSLPDGLGERQFVVLTVQ